MSRMNWDRVRRNDQIMRSGGDRVEPDLHGRDKTGKGKKAQPKNPKECPPHDWTAWARGATGGRQTRFCMKCKKQASRK